MRRSGPRTIEPHSGKVSHKLLIGTDLLYEGPVQSGNLPHGTGAVLFSNGDFMISQFAKGVAVGECIVMNEKGAVRARRSGTKDVPIEIQACLTKAGGLLVTHSKSHVQSQYLVCNTKLKSAKVMRMTLAQSAGGEFIPGSPDQTESIEARPYGIDVQIESLESIGLNYSAIHDVLWKEIFSGFTASQTLNQPAVPLLATQARSHYRLSLDSHSTLGAQFKVHPDYSFCSGVPPTVGTAKPSAAGLYLGPQTPAGGMFYSSIHLEDMLSTGVPGQETGSFVGSAALYNPENDTESICPQISIQVGQKYLVPHGEGVVKSNNRLGTSVCKLTLWNLGRCLSSQDLPNGVTASKLMKNIVRRMHGCSRSIDRLGIDIPHTAASKIMNEATRIMKHWIQPACGILLIDQTEARSTHQPALETEFETPADATQDQTAFPYGNERENSPVQISENQNNLPRSTDSQEREPMATRVEPDRVVVDWGANTQSSIQEGGQDRLASLFKAETSETLRTESDSYLTSGLQALRLRTINESPLEEDFCRSKDSLTPHLISSARKETLGASPATSDRIWQQDEQEAEDLDLEEWINLREQKLAWALEKCNALEWISAEVEKQIRKSRGAG